MVQSARSARPGATARSARPGATARSARPGATARSARSGATARSPRPGATARSARRCAIAVAAAAAFAGVVGSVPASAKGGVVGGGGAEFFLTNTWATTAEINFYLGGFHDFRNFPYDASLDRYVVGDWDGDEADTVGVRSSAVYQLRNTLESGPATTVIGFGDMWDEVLVGDWDGDGGDTLAVRRGNVLHLRNELSSGPATMQVAYGRWDDRPLVGDWDGDGDDTPAVRRGATYYFTNALAAGPAQFTQTYGRATDEVVVGDWNGDGVDTLGVRRENRFYLTNSFAAGPAQTVVAFGRPIDGVLVGDWDGDGYDTLGVRRDAFHFSGGAHVVGVDVPPGTYRSEEHPLLDDCTWQRRSSSEGGPDEHVLGSGDVRTSAIATISPTDVAFWEGCPSWYPVEATYPMSPAEAFREGTFVVGRHIRPGTYVASPTDARCTWERLTGFGGTPAEVIEAGSEGTVTILPSDTGFTSGPCGVWERQG